MALQEARTNDIHHWRDHRSDVSRNSHYHGRGFGWASDKQRKGRDAHGTASGYTRSEARGGASAHGKGIHAAHDPASAAAGQRRGLGPQSDKVTPRATRATGRAIGRLSAQATAGVLTWALKISPVRRRFSTGIR